VSPIELPILTVGEATYPQDHVTMTTYRWQYEGRSSHEPDALILVSIGVWVGATFYQDDRNSYIPGSEFISVHEDLLEQLQGKDGTAKMSAAGNAFSLGIRCDADKITVMGSIRDSRSGNLEEFSIGGVTRSHLESAVRSLQRILEWFQLA